MHPPFKVDNVDKLSQAKFKAQKILKKEHEVGFRQIGRRPVDRTEKVHLDDADAE
jgi:hypothetical protein